jgi:hypothetical protein
VVCGAHLWELQIHTSRLESKAEVHWVCAGPGPTPGPGRWGVRRLPMGYGSSISQSPVSQGTRTLVAVLSHSGT